MPVSRALGQRVLMELEVSNGKKEAQPRVQA